MTIRKTLSQAISQLNQAGITNPTTEAEILVGFVTGHDRAWLYSHDDQLITKLNWRKLNQLINDRTKNHKPLAYIVDHQPFLDFSLQVTPNVLIPRPETEYLVELVAEKIRAQKLDRGDFIDVGTGSGAIAIALKKLFPQANVTAIDNSTAALELAKQNAQDNKVKINLYQSDLLTKLAQSSLGGDFLSQLPPQFDVIVANLPYVPESDWPNLQPEIKLWEPKSAITAGADGLDLINKLITQAPNHLKPNGFIALEIDPSQPQILKRTTGQDWPNVGIEFVTDLSGRQRYLFAFT